MEQRARELHKRCRMSDRADCLGILCSCLCATHCFAIPLLFSVMPALAGAGLWGTAGAGKLLAAGSLLFAWFSLGPALRSAASKKVAILPLTGLTCVLMAQVGLLEHSGMPSVRHSAACQCAAYCGIPVGMCVSDAGHGETRLVMLQPAQAMSAGSHSHRAFRGWLSAGGAVLLLIGHVRNLRARKAPEKNASQDLLLSLVASSPVLNCQGSGITSTLTSRRC